MSSYNFKVVLLGQGCVGKTSLALRYVSNVFNDSHQSTLQASFLKKQLYLDQDLVRLNIWDTAGQEKFHALGPIYYREASGALLVYDVTSPDSLRKVRDWIKELNRMLGSQNVRLAIVGNKADLLQAHSQFETQQSQAQQLHWLQQANQSALVQEAVQLADELQNARHYLTSAKHNQGIGELFASLARRMLDQQKRLTRAQLANPSSRLMRRTISLANERDEQADAHDHAHRLASDHEVGGAQTGVKSNSCQC